MVLPLYRPDPEFLRLQIDSLAAQSLKPALLVLVLAEGEAESAEAGEARDDEEAPGTGRGIASEKEGAPGRGIAPEKEGRTGPETAPEVAPHAGPGAGGPEATLPRAGSPASGAAGPLAPGEPGTTVSPARHAAPIAKACLTAAPIAPARLTAAPIVKARSTTAGVAPGSTPAPLPGPIPEPTAPGPGTPVAMARARAEAAGIPVVLCRPGTPLDPVRAFEAGLACALERTAAGPQAPETLFALCDQDDLWHPDRLARGAEVLARGGDLVHSDARVVDAGGRLLHPSLFACERRDPRAGLRGLLYRNTVTGMTALMRRRVVELALPFPAQAGVHFYHDLWLALVAAGLGGLRRIDAALVDYRQHGTNAHGVMAPPEAFSGAFSGRSLRARLRACLRARSGPGGRSLRARLRGPAASYGLARALAQSLETRFAEAVAGGRLPHGAARLRPLAPWRARRLGARGHLADAARYLLRGRPGLARLALAHAAVSAGRTGWSLAQALGPGWAAARERFDTRLFALSPGVPPRAPQPPGPQAARSLARPSARPPAQPLEAVTDGRRRLRHRPAMTAPRPALVVLVPTLNPAEVFAGVATALDIGLGLAARGLPVRFWATDQPVISAAATRRFLAGRAGPRRREALARISVHCAVTGAVTGAVTENGESAPDLPSGLTAHRGDRFLATAWWTAHAARAEIAAGGYDRSRFLYLIQDFEPNFYPWGSEFAGALESYHFAHRPLFNSRPLQEHFAAQGLCTAPDALVFRPAVELARYAGPPRPDRSERSPRRLALYGRPEVARNMFPMAVEALATFIEGRGLGPREIAPLSVGLAHAPVQLPNGVRLESLGKLPLEDYPAFLRGCELGLSLMHSPHPSHPPLEMAAAGLRVVTNRFGARDPAALGPAFLSAPPVAEALAGALERAWDLPPLPEAARRLDLAPLGPPLESLLDRLAADLREELGAEMEPEGGPQIPDEGPGGGRELPSEPLAEAPREAPGRAPPPAPPSNAKPPGPGSGLVSLDPETGYMAPTSGRTPPDPEADRRPPAPEAGPTLKAPEAGPGEDPAPGSAREDAA